MVWTIIIYLEMIEKPRGTEGEKIQLFSSCRVNIIFDIQRNEVLILNVSLHFESL